MQFPEHVERICCFSRGVALQQQCLMLADRSSSATLDPTLPAFATRLVPQQRLQGMGRVQEAESLRDYFGDQKTTSAGTVLPSAVTPAEASDGDGGDSDGAFCGPDERYERGSPLQFPVPASP